MSKVVQQRTGEMGRGADKRHEGAGGRRLGLDVGSPGATESSSESRGTQRAQGRTGVLWRVRVPPRCLGSESSQADLSAFMHSPVRDGR